MTFSSNQAAHTVKGPQDDSIQAANDRAMEIGSVASSRARGLKKSVRQLYCPESFVDTTNTDGNVVEGQWRNEVDIDSYTTNRSTSNTSRNARTKEAHAMRESLKEYFNSPEGELPWQREIVNRGAYGDII
ncbi:unnamed protein product [Trichogramma brassicae]|uniref:Uncharacterized protein n=1 Tax=Trichogramma brassicae TaxID=86971 RepID=A0A6H5I9V4_9HYME|nr:unnamed protein product [Trichogramma brassicae]